MISTQILQSTVDGLKAITKTELSVIDREGVVMISTEDGLVGVVSETTRGFIQDSPAEGMTFKGYNYFKVFDDHVTELVVAAKGEDGESYRVGQLAAFQMQNLMVAYKERYDRDSFIKNLLLDNMLLVDIYGRAKKMNISSDVERVVYVIEIDNPKDTTALEDIGSVLSVKSKDFITALDEHSVILIKEVSTQAQSTRDTAELQEKLESTTEQLIAKLTTQLPNAFRLSIGRRIHDLKDVSLSYKEAKMALEVGRIFYPARQIVNYEELGIGRLIYQLPTNLCHMFMEEILGDIKIDIIDDETMSTVLKFFENNLNVSETSRNLYIHRNTLVYRLDKLQKMTGLDMRSFEHAILFKMLLMVSKYLNYMENQS